MSYIRLRHRPSAVSPVGAARPLLCALALAAPLLTGGCIYRINIHQGNFLEAKTLDQLNVGMTRSQVRFLLGTPMVADEFHPNRWDYYYYFKDGKTRHEETRHILVYFEDEKVARVEKPDGAGFRPLPKPATPGAS
jgi:outer membrane protein assembly factor BamE